MPRLLHFLRVTPDAPPLTDPQVIGEQFRYWRRRVVYASIVGYIGYYFVRKNLAVAMPALEAEFQIPKYQLGLILTVFGITYGMSKFINGFVGDRTNPRYFMAAGLFASLLINVLFGLSGGIIAFGVLWILNGIFQGMGWAPCVRTLVQWFSPRERGVKFAIISTSATLGASLVMFLNGWLIVRYGWRSCFFVPAGIALAATLFILCRLRDRPQSLGLPSIEKHHGEVEDQAVIDAGAGRSAYRHMVWRHIFRNPAIWIICLVNFFVYIIRYALVDWGPMFLTEAKGLDITRASVIVGGYELAGVAGMLVGGWAMDRVFHGRGSRAIVLFMGGCSLCLLAFWKLPVHGMLGNGLLLWGAGFLIYGPQCLVAVVAANFVPKDVGAAAVGFTGLFGYLSTIVSGWGLGLLVQRHGWDAGFLMLVIAAVLGMILCLTLWYSNTYHVDRDARMDTDNQLPRKG